MAIIFGLIITGSCLAIGGFWIWRTITLRIQKAEMQARLNVVWMNEQLNIQNRALDSVRDTCRNVQREVTHMAYKNEAIPSSHDHAMDNHLRRVAEQQAAHDNPVLRNKSIDDSSMPKSELSNMVDLESIALDLDL